MDKIILVIARYKEKVVWADPFLRVVITKDRDMENFGREASSYLAFILQEYDRLDGEYVFCQGNPFDHAPNFLKEILVKNYYGRELMCSETGEPHHPDLRIHEVCERLGLPLLNEYKFKAGAQFKVSAEEIRKRPIEWYEKAMEILEKDEEAPWIFERIWPQIFNLEI